MEAEGAREKGWWNAGDFAIREGAMVRLGSQARRGSEDGPRGLAAALFLRRGGLAHALHFSRQSERAP